MAALLSEFTTMRLGGPAAQLVTVASTSDLVEVVRDCDRAGHEVLILGGGSNLVIGDEGFGGVVVKVETPGLRVEDDLVVADAGVNWDSVVVTALDAGLTGLESLSGIPGSAGGTPIQNVGAYGTLTSDFLESVVIFDRQLGSIESWGPERCGFGSHRQSVFKHNRRYVVLEVRFRLRRGEISGPIRYEVLAARLGISPNQSAPVVDVRRAVLELRRERGMVLDPADQDTWSVGSFFINPVVPNVPEKAAECPQFADPAGTKLSAAWLIHRAGFAPGYGRDLGNGRVALSTKHALAVTNRGGATTGDVMRFAGHIRDGVEAAFDIRLGPECDLVNCVFA